MVTFRCFRTNYKRTFFIPTGTSNGIISSLTQGQADLSCAAFSITLDRAKVITYLPQIDKQFFSIWIRNSISNNEKLSWNLFLTPYSRNVWIVVVLIAMTTAVLIIITENSMPELNSKLEFMDKVKTMYISVNEPFTPGIFLGDICSKCLPDFVVKILDNIFCKLWRKAEKNLWKGKLACKNFNIFMLIHRRIHFHGLSCINNFRTCS